MILHILTSFHAFPVMLFQLFSPANLLLDFLETFKEKYVEVRVDPDPTFGLSDSPVLKHETHPFFFKLEGSDGVPRELDDLVLQATVLSTSLQSKCIEGDDWYDMTLLPRI